MLKIANFWIAGGFTLAVYFFGTSYLLDTGIMPLWAFVMLWAIFWLLFNQVEDIAYRRRLEFTKSRSNVPTDEARENWPNMHL